MAIGTVFIKDRSQAVTLPRDVRLPGGVHKADVRVCGLERVSSAVGLRWDSFFLGGPVVSDGFMEERANQHPSDRESF